MYKSWHKREQNLVNRSLRDAIYDTKRGIMNSEKESQQYRLIEHRWQEIVDESTKDTESHSHLPATQRVINICLQGREINFRGITEITYIVIP